ncbi:manganese efflux pump [Rhizobium sp. BK399]|nr:manganese efflux pump [Rhizobium sp. BK399]
MADWRVLLVFVATAIGTSLDAMAVGVSLAFLQVTRQTQDETTVMR